jgi:hypothetical protein
MVRDTFSSLFLDNDNTLFRNEAQAAVVAGLHFMEEAEVKSYETESEALQAFECARSASLIGIID